MKLFMSNSFRQYIRKGCSAKTLGIVVMFVITMCLMAEAHAFNIRILILDESYKSAPKLDEVRRVGNINGKLLFKGTEYSGKIEVFKGDNGLFVVNELPIEDYVKGVVKAEVGENWPHAALKAQAVAVRTYAIYNILHKNNGIYHVTSSTLSQLYKGIKTDPAVEEAVNATRGEVLTYDGRPINALYHSTSGGRTELPEEVFGRSFPYLQSVECDSSSSPFYIWERRIQLKELEQVLKLDPIGKIDVASRTKTGRARKVTFTGTGYEKVYEANDLRKILGWKRLPSTWFNIVMSGNLVIFRGKGYGHGVGMCQWSSMEMAKKGFNYKEILARFYPGTVIKLYEDR